MERVEDEERHLLTFFRSEYDRYQDRVPTGVPFVKGYRVNKAYRTLWEQQDARQLADGPTMVAQGKRN